LTGSVASRLDVGPGPRRSGPKRHSGPARPVPANYESLVTDELKTIMEFPGYTADNISKARRAYQAWGGQPRNTRFGWIRKG
jgi:hypothetical protein